MRVRLSDPTLIDEFLEFLQHSGFLAELSGPDTVAVSLPVTVAGSRSPEDMELFLNVWASISVRVWKDLWPDTDALVLAEPEPARRALSR